jgi:hypothetical protein
MTPAAQIDHLVIVADTLANGVKWCEETLGVTPGPGGEHKLMGTHNRLVRIATVDFPRAYLEIIAINPVAPTPDPIRAGRWFDMDSPAMRKAVAEQGPRLVHFAANVPEMAPSLAALRELGIDRGPALEASRMTPRGLLQWKITVRDDGQRLFEGAMPTLIEWGETHPAGSMSDLGVTLTSLTASHPKDGELRRAYEALGLRNVGIKPGPANLCAVLQTPRGRVQLESKGI